MVPGRPGARRSGSTVSAAQWRSRNLEAGHEGQDEGAGGGPRSSSMSTLVEEGSKGVGCGIAIEFFAGVGGHLEGEVLWN